MRVAPRSCTIDEYFRIVAQIELWWTLRCRVEWHMTWEGARRTRVCISMQGLHMLLRSIYLCCSMGVFVGVSGFHFEVMHRGIIWVWSCTSCIIFIRSRFGLKQIPTWSLHLWCKWLCSWWCSLLEAPQQPRSTRLQHIKHALRRQPRAHDCKCTCTLV